LKFRQQLDCTSIFKALNQVEKKFSGKSLKKSLNPNCCKDCVSLEQRPETKKICVSLVRTTSKFPTDSITPITKTKYEYDLITAKRVGSEQVLNEFTPAIL
jgi:hypothetical protein